MNAENRKVSVQHQQAGGQELKLLLLSVDGQVIGSCQIGGWNEDEPSILGVIVDPPYRRNGHGIALIQAAMELARDDRKQSLSLTVEVANAAAIGLYRRMGFVTDLRDPVQLWMSIAIDSRSKGET